jgi:hypothetical protein
MCMICTGIPAVLTLGVAAETRQRKAQKAAVKAGHKASRKLPFMILGLASTLGLMGISLYYHTQIGS